MNASSGIGERSRDIRRAESPLWVNATRKRAPSSSPTSAAARVIAPPLVRGSPVSGGTESSAFSSIFTMIRDIVSTATIGNLPTLVSPDSISASAPSRTALATSEASARVGREVSIIDSSIWVATITGLACASRQRDRPGLHERHVLERQLDAEVAAGDHDAVERVDDLGQVLDGLRLLDLGEHRQADALRVHDRAYVAWRPRRCGRTTAR